MVWTHFQLTVTTPLFNQFGPEVDIGRKTKDKLRDEKVDPTHLRVASIRGAMRFWFRALAGSRIGNEPKVLHKVESAVFGDTEKAAPVRMRLVPTKHRSGRPSDISRRKKYENGKSFDTIGYLLGQGLTDRSFTVVGSTFTLKVAFSEDEVVNSLTMASLWLACTYGGFGARTRKGFGGVRLATQAGKLPLADCEDITATPGIEHYEDLKYLPMSGPLERPLEQLEILLKRPDLKLSPFERPHFSKESLSDYPVLGEATTAAQLSAWSENNWQDITRTTGLAYRLFRASEPHERARYYPRVKTPEDQKVIRRWSTKREFPLGVLGLPIQFKDGMVNLVEDEASLRRASPLWFRFLEDTTTREWKLFSFAFHNRFRPDGTKVVHNDKPYDLTVQDADVRCLTNAWMERTLVNRELALDVPTVTKPLTFPDEHRRCDKDDCTNR